MIVLIALIWLKSICSKQKPNQLEDLMNSNQLDKLSFYAKEDAMQFAALLAVGAHACLDEIRFTVVTGELAYRVVKERYFKRLGYWKSV